MTANGLCVRGVGRPSAQMVVTVHGTLSHIFASYRPQVSDDTLTQIFGSILSWHFSKRGFPAQLASLAAALVSATLDVYSAAAAKLLPTPAKSHYLFNLRDFARVVQVCTMPPGLVQWMAAARSPPWLSATLTHPAVPVDHYANCRGL